MLESALSLFTQLALWAALAATQHWESGLQRNGWLESAWPFASLNLHWQYLPLNAGSLRRGATAAGRSCRLACKASSNWTCFGSSSSSLLACLSQSLRVSKCCHKFRTWSFKFEKAEGVNLKPCCDMCKSSQARDRGTCQSYDLGLTAIWSWTDFILFDQVRAIDWSTVSRRSWARWRTQQHLCNASNSVG